MRNLSLVFLALLAAAGCVDRAAQEQAKQTEALVKDPTVPVTVAAVRIEDLRETIEVAGSIATSDEADVGPAVPGRLVSVLVREGEQVTAGQTIATQETTSLNAQLRQVLAQASAARSALNQARVEANRSPQRTSAAVRAAEARLAQAQSQFEKARNGARTQEREQAEWAVRRAKSDLDTAKAALDRAQRLFREGAIAEVEVEQAQNAYANALAAYEASLQSQSLVQNATRPEDLASAQQEVRAAEENVRLAKADRSGDEIARQQVQSAQANLRAAEEAVQIARKALSDATIRSPFSGRVQGRPVQPGTYVAPGSVVAKIVGAAGSYFDANVPETRIRSVSVGMPVDVRLDALPDTVLRGSVRAVSPSATGPGRLVSVRIGIDERMDAVKPGMFAKGVIQTGVRTGALTVPSEAIIRDGETAYVFVVVDGKAKRKKVQLGIEQGNRIEISGLSTGDQVMTRGQTQVAEDTPVRIEQPASGTTQARQAQPQGE
ncbi:MAG: efflux RND transporter periplasmic adaptor subunit [Fimbriimonadaceae bacterium]|nr:efflux RND transporter periplasmic adaptor subunit [Fimbriimonadaceae bacterium]QYK55838.1 MAG: efflux RND transporter periplasmic adaptor subunit [Fimbriimonadaceae bacterium]